MGKTGVTGAKSCSSLNLDAFERKSKVKQDPTLKASNMLGIKPNCCRYGGDPVNMATGNFIYGNEYLEIDGLFPLSFGIFYNAQDNRENTLGHGWVHGFEASVEKDGHRATVFLEDGKQESFFHKHNGIYIQSQSIDSSLRALDGSFIYQNHEGLKYIFNDCGKLIKKEDNNANYVALSYDAQGKLAKAENNSDSSLEFSYNAGKLEEVKDNTGRKVSFGYQDNLLTCITEETGSRCQFEYDKQSKLEKIINPLGIVALINEYDENARMKKQVFPDSGVISYEYDDSKDRLILTEQNGNEIIYIHDSKHRSVEMIYADGSEKISYNHQDLQTTFKDKNGNTTRYSYDDRGNMVKVINPLGETTRIDYNNLNNPVQVKVCGDMIQQTTYDSRGNVLEIKDALDRISKIVYNSQGQPIRIIQPDGSEIDIEYDTRGNIMTIAEPGSVTAYEYDELNRAIATIDGNGNRTGYEYNSKDDITKVINALGDVREYEYNATGKVTKIVDFDGSIITREYNCIGDPCRLVDQEGNETRLEYDLMWNVTKQIDANGNASVYDYDALHRLIKVTNPLGHSMQYSYDPNGNVTLITDPRGGHTHLKYDALDRVTAVTGADGAKTVMSYNHMGQITEVTDALDQESIFEYDKCGQKTAETDPAGGKVVFSYNLLGQVTEIKGSAELPTVYEYLPGGLLSKVAYPDGDGVEYSYDKNKNIVSQISRNGYALYYEYDCLSRITKISSNEGQEKSFAYDAAGNVTAVTESNGSVTKYIYSPKGNLIAVVDPMNHRTEYGYDKLDNLIEVKQLSELSKVRSINAQNSDLRITKYVHDKIGRVEQVIDALGNTEAYTYDEAGNVTGKLDKDGYFTKYSYDPAGELAEVAYADGKSVRFSYNALKQLTEIKDWLGVTKIEVDELSRATKVIDHNGRTVEYSFNPAGEMSAIKYPGGKTVTYGYDEALRLKTLTDGDNRIEYFYDENSMLAERAFSNGASTKYSYNGMGLISELTHSDREGMLDKYEYTYDSMSNKTEIVKQRRGMAEESGKYQYTYDALSRLTGVAKDNKPVRKYGYDEFGNRSFMEDKGIRTDYTYNRLNQLLLSKSYRRRLDFSYDARGNLTRVLKDGRLNKIYEFGPMNRLTRAEGVDGKTADYVYSGLGHQVGKHISDAKNPMKSISFVLDLTREYHNLLQTTGEDGQIKNYIWDFNVLYEQNAPVNKSNSITNSVDDSGGTGTGDIVTDSVSRFYLQDDLGSTLRLTGTDSILISSFAYDEFGNNLTGYQNETQPFGFACEYFDSGSGLYNLQARHYNPLVGRMISEDPICGDILNPLSLNLYAYCHNDPVNFIDPGGMLDVMVKYIVEKNSGKIKNKYTIKIGNITKKYKKKDFKIIRGQLVIDNKKLMKDFCLTKAQSLHKEGDPFKTANHAAMAFGFRISPKAIKKDIEYGANIYKKSGSYTYKDVVSGTVASVTLKAVNSNYGTRVAYIHTHGGYTKGYVGTDFSTQDKKVAKWNNINAYLMTPNGYLLKYYKNQKKVIPLAKNMPYDKKYYKK